MLHLLGALFVSNMSIIQGVPTSEGDMRRVVLALLLSLGMMSPATAKDGAAGQAGDPHNAQQYYQRGLAEAQSGQNAAAIADFEQSILLDPNRFEAYQKLDDLLSAQRQWPTIIQYWSQYIQLHPNDGRAHCERGGTYSQLHDAPHTLADAEKGCSLGIATCCQALRNFQARQPAAVPPAAAPATGPPT